MEKPIKIRLPNESFFIEAPNFDIKDFKLGKKFKDTSFGWWKGVYIEIINKK